MRQEGRSKFSEMILLLVVMVPLMALMIIGFCLILGTFEIPQDLQTFLSLMIGGLVVSMFSLRAFSDSGFRISEEGLSVGRPFGRRLISFSTITRVDRVRRNGSKNVERVRVGFVEAGREKVVEITAANSTMLIHDLLRNCPQITQTKNSKLKKNDSFRAAKKAMETPRHQIAPVEY